MFNSIFLTSGLGASSGARVCDAVLACSASKDFCKDSLTLNDEIGQDGSKVTPFLVPNCV